VAKSPRFRIKFETGNHHARARALVEMRAIAAQASLQPPVERRLLWVNPGRCKSDAASKRARSISRTSPSRRRRRNRKKRS